MGLPNLDVSEILVAVAALVIANFGLTSSVSEENNKTESKIVGKQLATLDKESVEQLTEKAIDNQIVVSQASFTSVNAVKLSTSMAVEAKFEDDSLTSENKVNLGDQNMNGLPIFVPSPPARPIRK